jgi:predicted  nucleic acid-binding Zn-ribbon protein
MPPPNTYKSSSVNVSDSTKQRLNERIEAQRKKEQPGRWERFKAVITNKDFKTTVKNVGKGYKSVTDAVSKTGDPSKLNPTAQGFGTSGTVVGGVTQLFETGVDIYNAKQKVDKAKRDLETVEMGDLQKQREQGLAKEIADQLEKVNKAKKTLRSSESAQTKNDKALQDTRDKLTAKEQDIQDIEGRIRTLDERLRPGSGEQGVGSGGFLEQVQARLARDFTQAERDLARLENDWATQADPLLDEIDKIEGQLRALDENTRDAPELDTGTDVYEAEQERLNDKLALAKARLDKVDDDFKPKVSAKMDEVAKIGGKLREVNKDIGMVMEQRDKLKSELSTAKGDRRQLKKDIQGLEDKGKAIGVRVERKKNDLKTERRELKKLRTELGESLSTDKLKQRMAEKDLNQYNDDVPLERAKLMKSLLDGESATANLISVSTSGVSTVVSEGAKLAGGYVGVVVGPLTAVVNTIDLVNDHKGRMTALSLKGKASDALASKDGIKQDDAELLAIAERMRLKQGKNVVDKGLSATKNFFGAVGGIGTAAAGGATIAAIVGAGVGAAAAAAAVLTPVGWALAGAAAAAAVGYGIYKLVRHVNSQAIKEALKETISLTNNQDGGKTLSELKEENNLSKKQTKALDKVAEKCLKALKAEDPTLDIKKEDLTMDQLNDYACKKLVARDTGVAAEALLARFKAEVKAHLGDKPVTKEAMEQYLKTEAQKVPVDSAVGLMAKLGVGLKAVEAVDLYRDKSQSDGIKFLSKKMYSQTKETPSQEKNLSQGVDGAKVGKDKSVEKSIESPSGENHLTSSKR